MEIPDQHLDRRKQFAEVDRRNWQLWTLALAISISLALAIAIIFYPALRWGVARIDTEYRILPQLLLGLLTLVLLSAVYVITKQRELNEVRRLLVATLDESWQGSAPLAQDALTGILDRRALPDVLKLESTRADRYRSTLCLVLFDVRGFSSINVKEGNLAGDFVLKDLATTFQRVVRKTDIVMRYGPDEFLCLLPATDREGGEVFTRRAFTACEQVKRLAGLTLDFGISLYRTGEDLDAVLALAEQELEARKTSTENEVAVPLQCVECGSREMAQLTMGEYRALVNQTSIARSCTKCGVSTRWTFGLVEGDQEQNASPPS